MILLKRMKRQAALLVTLVYAAAVGCGLIVLALPSHVETVAAVRGDAAVQRERSIDAERTAFRAALLLLPWFVVLNPGNLGTGLLAIISSDRHAGGRSDRSHQKRLRRAYWKLHRETGAAANWHRLADARDAGEGEHERP